MVVCPYCSENMESLNLSDETHEGYLDARLYVCNACQLEQIIRWDTGERHLFQKNDNNGLIG